jgi:hypothetical protein
VCVGRRRGLDAGVFAAEVEGADAPAFSFVVDAGAVG